MHRRTFFFGGLAGLAGCRRSSQPRLNVYNWSNYIGPNTVAEFERQTGIRVRYGIFESSDELLAKALTGNCGWDVVFPTNHHVAPLRDYNLLAPLDHSRLPNLQNLASDFRAPEWDPQLQHSVPYMSTSAGIVYDRRQLGTLSRWADLWEAKVEGRMTMLDAQDDVLGACLVKLGHSWNSTAESELRAAQREAIRQKPLLRAYLNAEVRDQVVAGDVLAAQMWTTTMLPVMASAPQLDFVYPAEGFVRYAESAVVLRESPRQEAAHRFINFLLQPEIAAACVAAEKTGPVLAGVRELLPSELRDHPLLFPAPQDLARGVWLRTMPPSAQRLRDRLWTEIKSA
ncbi:MAG: spermidine/putrescine ABC transporter substrate-binding protein [Bryobacteraceae bacterium]|nr:spermidine/putrescine ABC transporter substrate-binding protein [Bryobacteraceae bacterium]